MGKPGAYLDIDRVAHKTRPVREAVSDFNDMTIVLSESDQMKQASRCMYCGVAFCQTGVSFGNTRPSGCPLHNLIPEWNDLVYRGLWDEAAERLNMTNPFPEFTGRVCPALCEVACNLGLHQGPTTIKDNERAISDHAWNEGLIQPLPKPDAHAPRVAVVGSGPAGLAVAWELTRLGVQVEVYERQDHPGGLLMYGIPNMKLPKEIVDRRIQLMKDSGVVFHCNCDGTDPDLVKELAQKVDAVILAAGAGEARKLKVPGVDGDGVHFAVDYLTSSTKSVLSGADPEISAKGCDVMVIGGGDTGTDCVATAVRQGARSVHQLELSPAPPKTRRPDNVWPEWPNVRKTDYGQAEAEAILGEDPRLWTSDTEEVLLDDVGKVTGIKVANLDWTSGKPERVPRSEHVLNAQMVLIAMGFTGPRADILKAWDVATMPYRGGVRPNLVQDGGHRAEGALEVPVFVAGDTRNGSSLVVRALADGLLCAKEVAEALKR